MKPQNPTVTRNPNKTLQAASALRRRCDGHEDMTLAKLVEICKELGLPSAPLAVTRLELNCQLFTRIGECITEYRDVQQLHLDRNRITRIENLGALAHLQCLYLQGNRISRIEGLDGLAQLRLLDLSANRVADLGGLAGLPRLEALLVADNLLADVGGIEHLTRCTALCELDLGHNQLADGEAVLQVLSAMPALRTLTLEHNPLARPSAGAAAIAAAAAAAPDPAPHHSRPSPSAVSTAATDAAGADASAGRDTDTADEGAGAGAALLLTQARARASVRVPSDMVEADLWGVSPGASPVSKAPDGSAVPLPAPVPQPQAVRQQQPRLDVDVDHHRPPAQPQPLAFYRRTLVARCRGLTALDHRAVFPQERRYAEAWWAEEQAARRARERGQGQPQREAVSQEAVPAAAGAGLVGGQGAVRGVRSGAGAAAGAAEGLSAGREAAVAVAAAGVAAPQPDGSALPPDVLYPVLSRLDQRSLAVSALACRHWAAVASFPLAAQRRRAAQAALEEAAAAVPRLAVALTDVRRDELDELLATEL